LNWSDQGILAGSQVEDQIAAQAVEFGKVRFGGVGSSNGSALGSTFGMPRFRRGSVLRLGHPPTKAFSRSPRNYQSLGVGSIDEPPAVAGVA
jgi:hypothetical protein